MSDLSADDRTFLNQNFQRYGSAWSGGLEAIERDFELVAESKWRKFLLHLTLRAPPAVQYTVEVKKKDGGMLTRRPELPDAKPLDLAALGRVDAILRELGELWLIEPPNATVRIVNLASGLEALRGNRELDSRLLGRRAALYMIEPDGFGDLFCLWLDLDAEKLEGVAWVELPMEEGGHWLRPSEVDFLERAMGEHGDFGVYGNVQDGLRSLVTHMEVSMRDAGEHWEVSATPRDGHGHFLDFPIDKKTGEIGDCAAGHLEPMPEDFGDDESEPEPIE